MGGFDALSCIAALAIQWCQHRTSRANIKSYLGATAAAKKGVAAPLALDLWNVIYHLAWVALCQLKIFKFLITRQAKFMFLTQWTVWRASSAAMIQPRGQTLLASAAFTNITRIAHKDTFLGLASCRWSGKAVWVNVKLLATDAWNNFLLRHPLGTSLPTAFSVICCHKTGLALPFFSTAVPACKFTAQSLCHINFLHGLHSIMNVSSVPSLTFVCTLHPSHNKKFFLLQHALQHAASPCFSIVARQDKRLWIQGSWAPRLLSGKGWKAHLIGCGESCKSSSQLRQRQEPLFNCSTKWASMHQRRALSVIVPPGCIYKLYRQ